MARASSSDLQIATAILETENTPAAILDARGTVAACNTTFQSKIGFDFSNEMFRRSLKMTLGTNASVPCGVRLGDGSLEHGKLIGLGGLGDERIILLRIAAKDQNRNFHGLTKRLNQRNRDVSAKARNESMFGQIFNATAVGILATDANGRVLDRNLAMEKMVGPIKHIEQLFPDEAWRSYLSTSHSNSVDGSGRVKLKSQLGEDIFAEMNVGHAKSVDGPIYVLVFQNVNDRIRLEEAKDAAQNADRQMKMAQLRDEAKTRFLSMISHELRTPLHGVISALELMDQHGIEEPELRDLFRIASRSSEAALEQVNRILEITRLEARIGSDVVADNFDPTQVVQSVIEQQSAYAVKSGNRINLTRSGLESAVVLGDAYLFRQIVQNLIGNALKFTKNGTVDVTLDVVLSGEKLKKINLMIVDTGVGFDVSQKDRLLQEFETGNDRYSRIEDGAGIGLALVNRAVARMSGELQIASVPGQGSSFKVSFELPRGHKLEPYEQDAKRDAGPSVYPLNVLVVDDAEINREVLTRLLLRFGCVTQCAEDGQAALDALALQTFDIVFMDVSMPEIDGIEATRRFRAAEVGSRTTIIGVTAHSDPETRKLCLEAGMEDVVVKPFRPMVLEEFLKRRSLNV